VTRFFSMTLGATLATGMIFMMQSPLLHQSSTSTSLLSRLNVPTPTTIAWPEVGSAALVIPALGIQRSHHNAVVPIASLTKLMTAYVVLQKLPLTPGETGPCLRVNADDVAYYDTLVDSGQSSAAVAVGETLCENQLLAGLLVHSAGNFATMLANLAWGGTTLFVENMNIQAHVLDLTGTHYVDVTGVGTQSVSTALDQGELAARLMQSAVVRAIVDQSSVTLPVAGRLGSYQPYIGLDNVVGVKSGRTAAAGGCDVMAMTFTLGGKSELAYAVVLGAQGGDLLGPAGDEALALEQSVLRSETSLWIPAGTVVGTLGWDNQRVNVVVKDHLELSWFTALHAANVRLHIDAETKPVKPGQVVGWLNVNEGVGYRVPLTVKRRVSSLSLFQRLR
jgi:D-alanyl-D-alanine carboxypeptidase (penicillin-binding protein 5/6)